MPHFQQQAAFPPSKLSIAKLVQTGKLDIYIRRICGLGDVLMAALVTKALQKKLSSDYLKIHFVTHSDFQSSIIRLGFCSSVITDSALGVLDSPFLVDLQGQVDFSPICKRGHRLDLMAGLVGLQPHEIQTDFTVKLDPKCLSWARKQLHTLLTKRKKGNPASKIIALAPLASTRIRSWPGWPEFLSLLLSRGFLVLFLHDSLVATSHHPHLLNLSGLLSLEQLFSVLQICDAAVVVDSGPLHVCGFLDIPFIGLFGSIDPKFRVGYYKRKKTIFLKNSCHLCPCWDWQEGTCFKTDYYLKCMNDITPQMVLKALLNLLKSPKLQKGLNDEMSMEGRSIRGRSRRKSR